MKKTIIEKVTKLYENNKHDLLVIIDQLEKLYNEILVVEKYIGITQETNTTQLFLIKEIKHIESRLI